MALHQLRRPRLYLGRPPPDQGGVRADARDDRAVLSAFFWTYALMQIPGGWLVDYLRTRGMSSNKVLRSLLGGAGVLVIVALLAVRAIPDPVSAVALLASVLFFLRWIGLMWRVPSILGGRDNAGVLGGAMNFSGNIAGIVTPMVVGLIVGATGGDYGPALLYFVGAGVLMTYRLLGDRRNVTAHFARVPVTRIGLDSRSAAQFDEAAMLTAAARLSDAKVDVVVWNGTAGSWLGVEHDMALAADVADQLRKVAEDAHACAVPCTNVHGAELAAELESELGVPVLDSVSVTLWHALSLAGARASVPGFGTLLRDGFVRARMQAVCEELLAATGADRTTLRVDVPAHDLGVDLTAAEALRPGTRSIRREGSLDQRRLNTVEWLEAHRVDLVQPNFHEDPHPLQALVDVYGVHAQMLGPVRCDGDMTGWLSVHSLAERPWREQDIAALDAARAQVEEIVAPLVRKGSRA